MAFEPSCVRIIMSLPHQQDQLFLGIAIVVAGCSYLGHYLVSQLLLDPDCNTVYVLDQNVDNDNRHGEAA
jgi:hypothetical protein